MSQGSKELVSRYATALFDLAKERGVLEQTEKELNTVQQLLAVSADASRMIHNPLLTRAVQGNAVRAILAHLGISTLVQNFCLMLAANRRLAILLPVVDAFLTLLSENKGEITAEVISAVPLKAAQISAIKASLKASLHHEIRLHAAVDPAILGGLIVKIGSKMVDDSLAGKLERLKLLSAKALLAV
jgi:F-type H+-transporting ATPase subunit delta